jgi:hypothetical protein
VRKFEWNEEPNTNTPVHSGKCVVVSSLTELYSNSQQFTEAEEFAFISGILVTCKGGGHYWLPNGSSTTVHVFSDRLTLTVRRAQ